MGASARLALGLSLTQWAVLGLLVGRPAHGFALAGALAPDSPLGQAWRVPRPLVYRALAGLEANGLVERAGVEPARLGPRRTVLRATGRGETELRGWLEVPSSHLRDLRSELLVKLYFHERLGSDPRPLLRAQRARVGELAAALENERQGANGFEAVLAAWRRSTARAAAEFLDEQLAAAGPALPPAGG